MEPKYYLIHNGKIIEFETSIGFLNFMEAHVKEYEFADFDIIYGNKVHYENGQKTN